MLKAACLIAQKDLRLTLLNGRRLPRNSPLLQALLLGLLIIFLFSLAPSLDQSEAPGATKTVSPAFAVIIFWISSLFAQTLIFQRLYSLEDAAGGRVGLFTAPLAAQAVWLGKALAGFILLLLVQIILFPALILLLGQTPAGPRLPALGGIILADMGLAALGALLGAFSSAARRAAQLGILSLPLLIPLLIAAARLCQTALLPAASAVQANVADSLGLLAAFDAIAVGAALLLFRFAFMDE